MGLAKVEVFIINMQKKEAKPNKALADFNHNSIGCAENNILSTIALQQQHNVIYA